MCLRLMKEQYFKKNKRKVVSLSYLDFADNNNFVLSIAGHNCLSEMVKVQNGKVAWSVILYYRLLRKHLINQSEIEFATN